MLLPGILAPIYLKQAVDALGGAVNEAAVRRTVHALILSGVCRILCSLAKEMQGPCFTPVAQVCMPSTLQPCTYACASSLSQKLG
jgi:hypothetical protein